eukprot:snap_masked-scaffold_11-processed-gene-2.17-mRNA-1 protein AED:0.05 eAED:0.13 QI:0/-1/0/1/-1/1/1/0/191
MGNQTAKESDVEEDLSLDMSEKQLSYFNGENKFPKFTALNGTIFDISESKDAEILKLTAQNHCNTPEEKVKEFHSKFPCIGEIISTKELSLEYIKNFKGEKNSSNPEGKIYLAAKGLVFDVSKGESFYGPKGGYHQFSGRNAQRALALTSLQEEDVNNSNLDDLTAEDLKVLDDWIQKYMKKYPHIGYLKE